MVVCIFDDIDIDVVIVAADVDGDGNANYSRRGASLYTSPSPRNATSCIPVLYSVLFNEMSIYAKDGRQVRPCRGSSPVRPPSWTAHLSARPMKCSVFDLASQGYSPASHPSSALAYQSLVPKPTQSRQQHILISVTKSIQKQEAEAYDE